MAILGCNFLKCMHIILSGNDQKYSHHVIDGNNYVITGLGIYIAYRVCILAHDFLRLDVQHIIFQTIHVLSDHAILLQQYSAS